MVRISQMDVPRNVAGEGNLYDSDEYEERPVERFPIRNDSPPPMEDYDYDDTTDASSESPYYSTDETPSDDGRSQTQDFEYHSNSDEHEVVFEIGGDESVDDEEIFNVDDLYNNPENLKVEYVGKHRMAVVDQVVDDSFLETTEPGAVPRMVVLDAANILHGFTPFVAGTSSLPAEEQKVDAAYILSLVRFFVSKGIECMVVSQPKYMLDSVTENTFVLKTLHELGLMMVMDYTYDDLVLFSVASEYDAVILTEDQFRAEKRWKEFMTPNVINALNHKISPHYPRQPDDFLPKSEWGKVSRNGHFVVDHLLRFEGNTNSLRQKLFSTEERGGHRFELVKEKHDSWLKRKDKVLSALDLLLARIQQIMEVTREDVNTLIPRN